MNIVYLPLDAFKFLVVTHTKHVLSFPHPDFCGRVHLEIFEFQTPNGAQFRPDIQYRRKGERGGLRKHQGDEFPTRSDAHLWALKFLGICEDNFTTDNLMVASIEAAFTAFLCEKAS